MLDEREAEVKKKGDERLEREMAFPEMVNPSVRIDAWE